MASMLDHTIYDNSGNSCSLRRNIWDEKSLDCTVFEITQFTGVSNDLLLKVDEHLLQNDCELCVSRVLATDFKLRKLLFDFKFNLVECSHLLVARTAGFTKKVDYTIEDPEQKHLVALRDHYKLDYDFGRYAEDPRIPISCHQKRMLGWFEQLLSEGRLRIVTDSSGQLIASFAYQVTENNVGDLILFGTLSEARGLGQFVLSAVCESLKVECQSLRARVSGANAAALNMYFNLGFIIKKSEYDFHRHYSNKFI